MLLFCNDCFICLCQMYRWPFAAEALWHCAGFQQHANLSWKQQQDSDQHQLPVWENHGKTDNQKNIPNILRWMITCCSIAALMGMHRKYQTNCSMFYMNFLCPLTPGVCWRVVQQQSLQSFSHWCAAVTLDVNFWHSLVTLCVIYMGQNGSMA